MLRTIFDHGWKRFRRSPTWNQNILRGVFMGLLVLFLGVQLIIFGFFADKVIEEFYPESDLVTIMSVFLVYYFLIDLVLRLVMQKYPFLDFKPYLIWPIARNSIVQSVLVSSLKSFFNFFPLFLIFPFAFKVVLVTDGILIASNFLLFFIGMIVLNNFLSFLIDRYFKVKPAIAIMMTSMILIVLYLDFKEYIGLRSFLEPILGYLVRWPLSFVLPFLLAGGAYYLLFSLFRSALHLEDQISGDKVSEVKLMSVGLFAHFGTSGQLMELESKLIWRNRRSRAMVWISILFLLYPLLFIREGNNTEIIWPKLFIGLFVTGGFLLNYGQLMLSWNSQHFDLLMSRRFRLEDIFKAKYNVLALSCLILSGFAMLYGVIDRSFLLVIPTMLLFNLGVSIFLFMLLAGYNSKRIDPGKGAMMNYEGIGTAHYLMVIPLLFLPYLFYLPFNYLGYPNMGVAFVGVVGLMGFLFRNRLVRLVTKLFRRNKYKIASAFRKEQ